MRILRVADVPNNKTGGMSRTMYSTGDALEAMGHQIEYLFAEDIPCATRGKMRRFAVPLLLPRLLRERAKAGNHYDLVEFHESIAAFYCAQRRKGSLPPVALFSYGLEERGLKAILDYRKSRGESISLKDRYSPLSVVLQAKYAVRHAQHVICSNASDVTYLQRAGVPADRLTQHHSGSDPLFLSAGAVAGKENRDRNGILFLGTWIQRKGILEVASATSALMREDTSLRLTIAGCAFGETEVLSYFAPEFRVRVRVIPKVVGNDALIDLYRRHAIFLLPSVFEGYPLVMVEAAAMGLAIVTTDICGMRDFIVHGENGYLVPTGDTNAIESHLRILIQQPERAFALGEAARATAAKTTWLSAAQKIEKAYVATAKL